MFASIISTVGKNEGRGAGPDLKVEYLESQILLKASRTNVKSFLYFGDYFLWYAKVMGPCRNALFPLYLALPGRLNNLISSWNDWRSRRLFFIFTWGFSNQQVQSFRCLLITRKRFVQAEKFNMGSFSVPPCPTNSHFKKNGLVLILKQIYFYLNCPNCFCDWESSFKIESGKPSFKYRILFGLNSKPFGTNRTVGLRPTLPCSN